METLYGRVAPLPVLWFGSFAIHILGLGLPIMTLQIYDRILHNPENTTLGALAMGTSAFILTETLLRLSRSYLITLGCARIEHALACATVNRITDAQLNSALQYDTADYLQYYSAIGQFKDYYATRAQGVWVDAPFIIIFLSTIAYLSGLLVLVPIAVVIAYSAFTWWQSNKMAQMMLRLHKMDHGRFRFLMEALFGIHTVKAQGLEPRFIRRFEAMQTDVNQLLLQFGRTSSSITTFTQFTSQAMIISITVAGALQVVDGRMTMGALIACVLLAGRIIQPLQRILTLLTRKQEMLLADGAMEVIDSLPQCPQAIDAQKEQKDSGLQCKNVSFQYGQDTPQILSKLNLTLRHGEVVAISGDHACGKTTLLEMLAGIHVPDEGHVHINGLDVTRHRNQLYGTHVALVPTQGIIFRGTVLENMTGFQPRLRKEALEMAGLLGLEPILAKLPHGLDTFMEGTQADALPPGVKQRITMVRALIHKPKIVLFDHADRGLDADGYNHVFKLLGRIRGQASMVIATDDANLLRLADREYRLEHGALVASAVGRDSKDQMPQYGRSVQL